MFCCILIPCRPTRCFSRHSIICTTGSYMNVALTLSPTLHCLTTRLLILFRNSLMDAPKTYRHASLTLPDDCPGNFQITPYTTLFFSISKTIFIWQTLIKSPPNPLEQAQAHLCGFNTCGRINQN